MRYTSSGPLVAIAVGALILGACRGVAAGVTPIPITAGPTATPTVTKTPTVTPISSPTPVPTAAQTPTPAPTVTGTPTPALTATAASTSDLSIQKTAQCNPPTGSCTFTVQVVNNGPGPYTGGLNIQDTISPSTSFVMTGFGGGAGTLCYLSGSTINCGPHYPLNLPAGGTYTLTIGVQISSTGTFQNCATLLLSDSNPTNNQVCVGFSVTGGATPTPTPDLTVQKTTQCSSSYTCVFTITVTNQGPGPYTGPLTVSDQTTPSWSTLLSGGGSISGASCSGPSPNVVCQAPSVTLAPGQSYSFSFGVYFGPSGYSQPFQNCASLPPNTDSNPANNQACINISPPGSMPSLMPTLIPASSFPPASSRLLA